MKLPFAPGGGKDAVLVTRQWASAIKSHCSASLCLTYLGTAHTRGSSPHPAAPIPTQQPRAQMSLPQCGLRLDSEHSFYIWIPVRPFTITTKRAVQLAKPLNSDHARRAWISTLSLNKKFLLGQTGLSRKFPATCPLALMLAAEVMAEPGASKVVNVPPLNAKPCSFPP